MDELNELIALLEAKKKRGINGLEEIFILDDMIELAKRYLK